MSKADPRVPLPEVTAAGYLLIDMASLEALESYFGPKWYSLVMEGLDGYRVTVMRKLLEVGIHDATPEQAFEALDPETICSRLLDALMRMLKGKSLAELAGAR